MGQPSQFCLRRKSGQRSKSDRASKVFRAHPAPPRNPLRNPLRNPPHSLQVSPQPGAKPLPPHRQARRAGLHRGLLAAWCPIHPLAACLHRPPRRILPLCPLLRLPMFHRQQAPQQGMIPGIIPAMRPERCRPPCQTANRAMRRIRQCRILQCHILLAPMRLRRILAHRGEMLFMAQASYRAIRLPTGALPPSTAIRKQVILLRL